MAILKMKMVNIVGPVEQFERIVSEYVVDRDIHLENVFNVLENIRGLYPFSDENRTDEIRQEIQQLIDMGDINPEHIIKSISYLYFKIYCDIKDSDSIKEKIKEIKSCIESLLSEKKSISDDLARKQNIINQLKPLLDVDIDLNKLFSFEFIKLRIGKMPVKSYETLEAYLTDMDAFFIPTSRDEDYVWGIYFMPTVSEEKIDAIFTSLLFQRVRITNEVHGTPKQFYEQLKKENENIQKRIKEIDNAIKSILKENRLLIAYLYERAIILQKVYEVKKYSAHTKSSFYVVGWMPEKYIPDLEKALKKEEKVVFLVENAEMVSNVTPPSKMSNNLFVRPFEMFVRMYGLPGYNEFDPTFLVAITYTLFFGAMFGDIGQGLVLALAGFLLFKFKKSDLGAIGVIIGISSAIFGFVYGSIFGFEDIIHGLIKPMENINNMLLYAVVVGAVVIGLVMIINIIIGIKNRNIKRAVLSHNGLAGFILYWSILLIALKVIFNGEKVSGAAIASFIIFPSLMILLQEPLAKLVEKRKDWMPEQKGMFLLEAVFEIFEVILSFVTNTMSFIRIGAFSLIHAGMMGVVFTLSHMIGKSGSIIVYILGNILVMALEGLIVGIQTLRLEFYEMFSRFYGGSGKEFKSLRDINTI